MTIEICQCFSVSLKYMATTQFDGAIDPQIQIAQMAVLEIKNHTLYWALVQIIQLYEIFKYVAHNFISSDDMAATYLLLKKCSGKTPKWLIITLNLTEWVSDWHPIWGTLSGDSGQWSPCSPYKLCNKSLYNGLIIFPHTDNIQFI